MRKNEVSNWYTNKHKDQNVSQAEIERKWRMYLWEKEQMELSESISNRGLTNSTISSGGGGSLIVPESNPQVELTTQNGQVLQTQNGLDLILE